MFSYKVIRFYMHGGKRTIKRGLTLQEAQEHCRSPEASSKTCYSAAKKRITKAKGPWFDGYDLNTKG